MRILVLEDDHKVATFIQRGLEEEGYAVDVLHDGVQAGVRTQSIDYDAAVLDLMLPCSRIGRRDAVWSLAGSALEAPDEPTTLAFDRMGARGRTRTGEQPCQYAC